MWETIIWKDECSLLSRLYGVHSSTRTLSVSKVIWDFLADELCCFPTMTTNSLVTFRHLFVQVRSSSAGMCPVYLYWGFHPWSRYSFTTTLIRDTFFCDAARVLVLILSHDITNERMQLLPVLFILCSLCATAVFVIQSVSVYNRYMTVTIIWHLCYTIVLNSHLNYTVLEYSIHAIRLHPLAAFFDLSWLVFLVELSLSYVFSLMRCLF